MLSRLSVFFSYHEIMNFLDGKYTFLMNAYFLMAIIELGAALKRCSSWLQGRQQPERMKEREMT